MKKGISRPYQDQSRRAEVYEQFLLGKSAIEAAKEICFPIYYVNEVYRDFIKVTQVPITSRLTQVKIIEKELWKAIESQAHEVTINRLQEAYCKFCI